MKISDYANTGEEFITFFENRYGGGYIFGVFSDIKMLERLQFAATYEYEQHEFKLLAIYPGVLPFVECESIAEGVERLNTLFEKINPESHIELYLLTNRLMDVFPPDDKVGNPSHIQFPTLEEVKKEIENFKKKWGL